MQKSKSSQSGLRHKTSVIILIIVLLFVLFAMIILLLHQLSEEKPRQTVETPQSTTETLPSVMETPQPTMETHRLTTEMPQPTAETPQPSPVTETSAEISPHDISPWGYSSYTGYLDECYQWTDYESFADCDYNEDGIPDRVYREYCPDAEGSERSLYRIELSGESPIEISNMQNGVPVLQAVDPDMDKEWELLFTCNYEFSSRPNVEGLDIVFLDKTDDVWQQVELPFEKEQYKYYVNFSIEDNSTETSVITYQLPGQEVQRQTLQLPEDFLTYNAETDNGRLFQIDIGENQSSTTLHFNAFFDACGELVVNCHYTNGLWKVNDYIFVAYY